jgi:hypothetical protein
MRKVGKLEARRGRTAHTGDADDKKLLATNTPAKWWREWLAGGGKMRVSCRIRHETANF